ncbi:uncharacterized protein LACBIDRAFT_333422 [Laccaria bicolor S238N-H82]|uniref:Predicted protein n=1 Tax=Laccaria bicolor (strain S238N-H82 / ATCC MYA-4686) TaxID=486041 RepID=B0DVV6_LACBS|nr:uncharacterized protein LACBIDRAFT_333422 [Laccaria bicolor S238N-H82]EDR01367.1 predicted protein [Laccaria bicolor S238N-H82]|eukprot:XP_001888074.1 predicted protein [Laccaria bicolor S238N-H82]
MLLSMLMFSVLVLPSVLLQRAIEGGGLRFGLGVTVGVYKCDVWDVCVARAGFWRREECNTEGKKKGDLPIANSPRTPRQELYPSRGMGAETGQRKKEESKEDVLKARKNAKRDPSEDRLRIEHLENGRKRTHLAHPGKARTIPSSNTTPTKRICWLLHWCARNDWRKQHASDTAEPGHAEPVDLVAVLSQAVAAIDDISFGDVYPLLLMLVDPDRRARAYYH